MKLTTATVLNIEPEGATITCEASKDNTTDPNIAYWKVWIKPAEEDDDALATMYVTGTVYLSVFFGTDMPVDILYCKIYTLESNTQYEMWCQAFDENELEGPVSNRIEFCTFPPHTAQLHLTPDKPEDD